MTTVLKAVIPLAVNPDKGDESADGDEKTKKLTAKDVLAAADKLLENMDMSGHNIAVTTGAAPPVILTDIVMKGPEEGKRRYNLVPGCVCYECEQQGVDPAQPPRGVYALQRIVLQLSLFFLYQHGSTNNQVNSY